MLNQSFFLGGWGLYCSMIFVAIPTTLFSFIESFQLIPWAFSLILPDQLFEMFGLHVFFNFICWVLHTHRLCVQNCDGINAYSCLHYDAFGLFEGPPTCIYEALPLKHKTLEHWRVVLGKPKSLQFSGLQFAFVHMFTISWLLLRVTHLDPHLISKVF